MKKKYSTPYQKLSKASDAMAETQDCAVIAIAVVGNLTYKAAHKLLEHAGRKSQTTTQRSQIYWALGFLNLKIEDVTKPCRHKYGVKTIRTLSRVLAGRSGVYLAYTRDHIMAIKDGVIHAWLDGRLHRIIRVEELRTTHDER